MAEDFPTGDNRREVAGWGDARLLIDWDGKMELVGGTEADREKAKERIRQFVHDRKVKGVD
jgi:hypothetical protein